MFKKYVLPMVLSLAAIAVVSFGQQIVVQDNASTTAPVSTTRVFGEGYVAMLGVDEIATPTAYLMANTIGTLRPVVRVNGASTTLRISVKLDDESVWYYDLDLTEDQ